MFDSSIYTIFYFGAICIFLFIWKRSPPCFNVQKAKINKKEIIFSGRLFWTDKRRAPFGSSPLHSFRTRARKCRFFFLSKKKDNPLVLLVSNNFIWMRSLVSAPSKWNGVERVGHLVVTFRNSREKQKKKTKYWNKKKKQARQEPVGPGDSQQTAGLRAFSLTCHWEPKVEEATEQEKDWADRSGNTTGAPRHV